MTLTVQFLPARQGDAIWVRWSEADGAPAHQAIIDMGTEATGRALALRLAALPEPERTFDLLVVTHVDGDHIGGVLSCLTDPATRPPGVRFRDVWFNGWAHLHGEAVPRPEDAGGLESMGPAQGERLTRWLLDQPWNEAFGRGPALRPESGPVVVDLPGGLRLTVLGPSAQRLADLESTWREEVELALSKGTLESASPGLVPPGSGLETYGPKTPPIIESRVDLELLAEERLKQDTSKANGASITLLAEWQGRRLLFTGDAYAADVAEGLASLGDSGPVALDMLKLPHHGSRNNLSKDLVEAVVCPVWVFSTDGTQFRHPDPVAIARILTWGTPRPRTLAFSVPSTYSLWWDNPVWQDLGAYDTLYGDGNDGLTLTFEPASPCSHLPAERVGDDGARTDSRNRSRR